MNNLSNSSGLANRSRVEGPRRRLLKTKILAASTILLALAPSFVVQAQNPSAKVTNLATHTSANETTVSIAADGSLSRAQTWQDGEGYHVVIPNTVAAESIKASRGLKVRRIGSSLEILVQTKPGARVNAYSSDGKLNVVIAGKLDSQPRDYDAPASASSEDERTPSDRQYSSSIMSDSRPFTSSSVADQAARSRATETAQNSTNWNPQMGPVASAPSQPSAAAPLASNLPPSDIEIQPEDDGWVASVFSGSSVLVVMSLGLFGLLVSRRLRSRQVIAEAVVSESVPDSEDEEVFETSIAQESGAESAGTSLVKDNKPRSKTSSNGSSALARQTTSRMQVAGPTSLFGAYRIDQEVGKLVYGQAHRLDVLSSRAIDDRRAIEASLIKSVNSRDLEESGRRKAREALEEYGFVARQCAALLLAPDAFERTSAARALGEIKSAAALPFLLEGLYDAEPIVRNQAVVSIGELKLPAAIGALLDIARTHPDVPSALLSRTLSACSVEGLDFFDAVMPEPGLLGSGDASGIVEQITHLEPTHSVEDLQASLDDEVLSRALVMVQSDDVQERAEGLKLLPQFRVQCSVEAMALVATNDSEPNLRSLAIASLGTVNHESVFPAILIGMADDSREVRASAARSLNRLSFDRSEAYVRVIETSDPETITAVAKACIQAGIVSQNLDRLATSDHRQAYETFSLISLLAKAKMNQPVLNAIADHQNGDVRIKAVHLLACTGQPEVTDEFRELAVRDGMRDDVKTALLEALYKLEQSQQNEPDTEEAVAVDSDPLVKLEETAEIPEADDQPALVAEVSERLDPEAELEVESAFQFEFVPTVPADVDPHLDESKK